MCLCTAIYMGVQVVLESRRGCHYLLELDLEAVVRFLTWLLRTDPGI